jgi:hypothetical protein
MGYDKIQTYILEHEPGTSIKAAGWRFETMTTGGNWKGKRDEVRFFGLRNTEEHLRGKKQRWSKSLRKEGL